MLAVYKVLGQAMPTAPPLQAANAHVTITAPDPGYRYYVVAGRRTGTPYGPWTITATQAGCDWHCNETGTFSSPRYLPSSVGGFAWNAIDHPNTGSTYGTWDKCHDGTACDWYRVDLSEGERVTATLSNVFDTLCDLELSVFAPTTQGWWEYNALPPESGTSRAPIVTDIGGSVGSHAIPPGESHAVS